MKVSVLIPTYNRAYIISDALDSVLKQTYRDFEIIIVDDGSSDGTRDVVEGFRSEKIRYLTHQLNRGCSAAYNTGISAAEGELVAFLDSDDIWKGDYLERQVAFFLAHPEVDVVFTDTEIQNKSETIPSLMRFMTAFPRLLEEYPKGKEYVLSGRQMYRCLLEEVPIKPSACLIKRGVLQREGMFDEAWPSGTDWDLFLRLSHSACFGYFDCPLVVQRRTSDATHYLFREQDHIFLLGVLLKEKAALGRDPEGQRAVNRGLSIHYNSLAWAYLEKGEGLEALSIYLRGFKETRRPLLIKKFLWGVLRIASRTVSIGRRSQKGRNAHETENCVEESPGSGLVRTEFKTERRGNSQVSLKPSKR